MPAKCARKAGERSSASAAIERPEVTVATSASGGRAASTSASSARLAAKSSAIASKIRSASRHSWSRPSAYVAPHRLSAIRSDFAIVCTAAIAPSTLARSRATMVTVQPPAANSAAAPAPIAPFAPSTTTCRKRNSRVASAGIILSLLRAADVVSIAFKRSIGHANSGRTLLLICPMVVIEPTAARRANAAATWPPRLAYVQGDLSKRALFDDLYRCQRYGLRWIRQQMAEFTLSNRQYCQQEADSQSVNAHSLATSDAAGGSLAAR